jgi:hypothetical protein
VAPGPSALPAACALVGRKRLSSPDDGRLGCFLRVALEQARQPQPLRQEREVDDGPAAEAAGGRLDRYNV